MKPTMYRQGDLLFILTNKAPLGKKKKDKIVLGSSITGHNHEITDGEVFVNEPSFQNRANFYVSIPLEGARLIHPEHREIPLSGGVYEVIRQREVNGYVRD